MLYSDRLAPSGESLERALLRFTHLDLAVAWRRAGLERMNQFVGGGRDFVDCFVERFFIQTRRLRRSTQLAHELQRRRAHFIVGCRRFKVGERLDVSAHAQVLVSERIERKSVLTPPYRFYPRRHQLLSNPPCAQMRERTLDSGRAAGGRKRTRR